MRNDIFWGLYIYKKLYMGIKLLKLFYMVVLASLAEIGFAIYSQGIISCVAYQTPRDVVQDTAYVSIMKCVNCQPGFILIEGICYCPEGSFLNIDTLNNPADYLCKADTSIPFCIDGVYKSLAVKCSSCGYGTKLNSLTNTCDCLAFPTGGGCTSIPFCSYVMYPTSKTQICISCKSTFRLFEGRCICDFDQPLDTATLTCTSSASAVIPTPTPTPSSSNITIVGCITAVNSTYCSRCGYGMVLNSGNCSCTFNVSGGCTSIAGCNFVRYPTSTTQECISCKSTFVLDQKICICGVGTYYESATDSCIPTLTSVSPSSSSPSASSSLSSQPSDSNLISVNQMLIILVVFGLLFVIFTAIILYLICKKGKAVNPSPLEPQKVLLSVQNTESSLDIQDFSKKKEKQLKLNEPSKIRRKRKNESHQETYDIQQFSLKEQQFV